MKKTRGQAAIILHPIFRNLFRFRSGDSRNSAFGIKSSAFSGVYGCLLFPLCIFRIFRSGCLNNYKKLLLWADALAAVFALYALIDPCGYSGGEVPLRCKGSVRHPPDIK